MHKFHQGHAVRITCHGRSACSYSITIAGWGDIGKVAESGARSRIRAHGARERTTGHERDRAAEWQAKAAVSWPAKVKSPVAKRSLVIGTQKTSITLETSFWEALKDVAAQ